MKQVAPAHHVGDVLRRVIDHHRKVVAGRRVLTGEDHVAPGGGIGGDGAGFARRAGAGFRPGERVGAFERSRHVEPQRVRHSGGHAAGALGGGHCLRIAGIKRRAVGIARPRRLRLALRHHPRHFGSAFEARIDDPHRIQPGQRRAVVAIVLGLPPHRLLPHEAEPSQVFVDGALVFPATARLIDVLDAQQQPSARSLRHIGIEQGRQRVAEMQMAVGRRRETENGWHAFSIYRLACYTDSA